jgi:hypothetical protein
LILLALVLAALAFGIDWLLRTPWVERYATRLCPWLCRIAVILAFLTGLALGLWLCLCGATVWRALAETNICIRYLLLLLLLLVAVLTWLALAIAACRAQGSILTLSVPSRVKSKNLRTALAWSVPLLLILILIVVLIVAIRCCAEPLSVLLYGDQCTRAFAWIVLLFLIAVLLALISLRYCREPKPTDCRRIPQILYLALLLALVALILLIRCCQHLPGKNYDLAMIGIWWEGQQPDESGAHLRWAFRYGLEFPAGGFDLFRRESAGGTWAALNTARIRPVTVFSDGAPAPGPMWQHRAVDRLHPSRWTHFQGTPFTELQDMLARPAYGTLYFVQQPDDPTLPQPTSPYASQGDLQAYLDAYSAAGTPAHPAVPLAQWELKPIDALLITAVDPEIARLLGLLYIDKTADPSTEYDYRVIGYWPDGERSWTAYNLSRPNTAPLAPPILTAATTPLTMTTPGGGSARLDLAVGLRWDPPVLNPASPIPSGLGITAVRTLPRRKDLGVRPCPAAAPPDPSFAVVQRPTETGSEPVSAVVAIPTDEGGTLVWPDYFFVDRFVDYRCYGYGLEGIDLFGRSSVLSNTRVADVIDLTGPPPPVNVTAVVYQRADVATLNGVTPAFRDRLFPPGSTHAAAAHVSWVWPSEFRTTVPDLAEFRVYLKLDGYETFSQPANQALWPVPGNWGPFPPVTEPATPGAPLPPHLIAAGVTNGEYFETIINDPPMSPDDNKPVVYGYAGVGGVDRAPFSNAGPVSPPIVIFARDFDPPPAPPIPTLDNMPEATDKGANAALALSWNADQRYLYHLVRMRGSEIVTLPLPADVPACLAPEAPTCTDSSPECQEEHRQFDLRRRAIAHASRYQLVSLEPRPPVPVGADHRFQVPDKVDASVGDDYLYAGRAIDPAGNVGPIGCPQLVRVRDFLPPRAPIISSVLGIEGGVRLEWIMNPESDLDAYRLLRTTVPDNDGSLDRMALVLEIDRDGTVRTPTGAAAPVSLGTTTAYPSFRWDDTTVRSVTDYRYRLVAIDRSGNISELSSSARGRAVDTTPPDPPLWGMPPAAWETAGSDNVIRLRFAPPPGDPDATYRIQRRDTGSAFWRPVAPWLNSGTTEYVDSSVKLGNSYAYRIQAMDNAGNTGEFNSPRSPP